MTQKFTAEEVRAHANLVVLVRTKRMLTAFANRIEADESAVPDYWAAIGEKQPDGSGGEIVLAYPPDDGNEGEAAQVAAKAIRATLSQPADSGRVTELLAYLDNQAQHPRDQFGNGSNKPNPTLKAWYAKQAAIVRALAAQGQGEPVVEIGECAEVIWNQGGPCQLPPGAKLYLRPSPPASPAGVPDGWVLVPDKFVKAASNYIRCSCSGTSLSPYIKENGLHGGSPWAEFVEEHDALLSAAAPSAPEGGK